jgi:hypothetical protein
VLNQSLYAHNGNVRLRLETGIVRNPDHYCDDEGKEILDMVVYFLEQKRAKPIREPQLTLLPNAA